VACKITSTYISGKAGASGSSVESTHWTVIDVSKVAATEVVVAAVVPEVAMAPVSATEAGAEVSEAIVDAAVVADGRSPVSGVPEVAAVTPAPVSGGPERIFVRRFNPGSVDPFIALTCPGPVAGSPDIAFPWNGGLHIHRNSWWGNRNR